MPQEAEELIDIQQYNSLGEKYYDLENKYKTALQRIMLLEKVIVNSQIEKLNNAR